jgi:hypothetical protein
LGNMGMRQMKNRFSTSAHCGAPYRLKIAVPDLNHRQTP